MKRDRTRLTDNELKAVFWHIHQSSIGRYYKRHLNRAVRKLQDQLSDRRREAIFAQGRKDARAKLEPTYKFEGVKLGSMESNTYGKGYNSVARNDAR